MTILNGKILRLDLSSSLVDTESYRPYKDWLGGQGLNQYILFNEMPEGIDAFNPANIIAVGSGALVGTAAPGASRTNIDTLSPLTGGIGSANAGGHFARALRLAGLHNIIIKGKAEDLVYIKIEDQKIDVVNAEPLKGKTVSESAKILRDELGADFKLLLIGPAGENMARSANVMIDGARSASRCGVGGVMGSKNLKAIAVRGTQTVVPDRPEEFKAVVRELSAKLKSHPMIQDLTARGVYANQTFLYGVESPYRNFSGQAIEPEKRARIAPEHFLPFKVESKTCSGCPIGCWKVYRTKSESTCRNSEALQINSIHNFAAKLDLFDPETILEAHALCNDLGLDEDNTCGVIAWAFDCFAHGIITTAETEGLELLWGNKKAVFRLIEDIAWRRGLGDLLADGCCRAAENFPGSEELCVHVKGQELFESIWISPAWALGTVVAARGGTHTRGAVLSNRLEDLPPETCRRLFGVDSVGEVTDYENKEKLVGFFELLQAVTNSLGVCYFTHGLFLPDLLLPEDFARLYSAASGQGTSADRLMWLGERIFNLEKCFNVRHTSWSRAEDRPPNIFFNRPLDGRYRLDLKAWEEMLTRYYLLHGWDEDTGRPKPETLTRLGLDSIRKKLIRQGKIPSG